MSTAPARSSSWHGSPWLLLAAAVLSEVTASLSLKAALDHPVLYLVVAPGYGTSFPLLSVVLRRGMPLGVAYGVWSACGVALTAVLSTAIFGEAMTPLKGVGIALVIAGVLAVELGAQQADPAAPVGRALPPEEVTSP